MSPPRYLSSVAPPGSHAPVVAVPATAIPPDEAVDWLWRPYLARGTLTLLDGDPGVGKSLIALDLAARLTTGRAWPGEKAADRPAERVLIANAEDPIRKVL